MSARALAALLVLLGSSACAPGGSDEPGAARQRERRTAAVSGTALNARTGEPLAGVVVTGPGGVCDVSDERGRFLLEGIPEGTAGELVARSREGWEAVNRLRPLRRARLEVVLHLLPPQQP